MVSEQEEHMEYPVKQGARFTYEQLAQLRREDRKMFIQRDSNGESSPCDSNPP